MTLTGPQRKQLNAALLSAFPEEGDLKRLVAFRFKTYLAHLTQRAAPARLAAGKLCAWTNNSWTSTRII